MELPNWLSCLSGIPDRRRGERVLVFIQAYVDESWGEEVFVFSALIGSVGSWVRITDEWDACLRESPSVRHFKMDEAFGLDNEFYQFTQAERDNKLRRLCSIINTQELTQLCATMVLSDFGKHFQPYVGRPASEPYFFPFQMVNAGLGTHVGMMGLNQPCEVFFDENKIFGPRAKAWYPVIKENFPAEIKRVMPVEPFFRSDKDVLPLQCADLTAWMMRNANEKGCGEFEWVWDAINKIRMSDLSDTIDEDWWKKMYEHEASPEERERAILVLKSYRETFGHDWPPKTKIEKKRHTGRL